MSKLKVLLHYPPWGNRWIPYIREELARYDLSIIDENCPDGEMLGKMSEKADLLFSCWCNETPYFWSKYFPDKKIISYLRRYELWTDTYHETDYQEIDALIFVSKFCQESFHRMRQGRTLPKREYLIPNGVDINQFTLRENRPSTKKIAFVCSLKHVKNVPLAVQLLINLPEEYKIHHIGIPFTDQITGQLISYIYYHGMFNTRFNLEGLIKPNEVIGWLQDKDVLLSTSINEGNPVNIIEAMAMGIKPVIHDWPGSRDQFPEDLIYTTIDEGVEIIKNDIHEPERYRQWVEDRYPLSNYAQIHQVIEGVMGA